jgi:hypothetical protein
MAAANEFAALYQELEVENQECASPHARIQKSDTEVTQGNISAPTNPEENVALNVHKKLFEETYSEFWATPKGTSSDKPPSHGLAAENPGHAEDKSSMTDQALALHHPMGARSVEKNHSLSTTFNSSELALVAKNDNSHSKVPGPVIGSILGACVLLLLAMMFVAWRKKRMQTKTEKDEENQEEGQVVP